MPDSDKLIFKGGTALRLLFESNRFSEDLDFTTTLEVADITFLVQKAVKLLNLEMPDLTIKDLKTLIGISKKLYLSTPITPQPLTIKLDFSQRESVFHVKSGIIKTILPISSTVIIKYLDPKEVLAEKCRAIMNREKGRDIYDLWYLLHKGIKLDVELIQKKLNYYQETYAKKILMEKVSAWKNSDLENDLRRFLPQNDRGVIEKLKEFLLDELDKQ